jgi:hypothetical protein
MLKKPLSRTLFWITASWLIQVGDLTDLPFRNSRKDVFRRESSLRFRKLAETLDVVFVPEIELDILCAVFDVNQILHEVTASHRLGETSTKCTERGAQSAAKSRTRTGHVAPLMILSKERRSGIPAIGLGVKPPEVCLESVLVELYSRFAGPGR